MNKRFNVILYDIINYMDGALSDADDFNNEDFNRLLLLLIDNILQWMRER